MTRVKIRMYGLIKRDFSLISLQVVRKTNVVAIRYRSNLSTCVRSFGILYFFLNYLHFFHVFMEISQTIFVIENVNLSLFHVRMYHPIQVFILFCFCF